jgi:hypothetical protein
MNAILAESGLSHAIRIIPFEDGWLVAFNCGRYAFPENKDEAIKHAEKLARGINVHEIAVCNAMGTVTETRDVFYPTNLVPMLG